MNSKDRIFKIINDILFSCLTFHKQTYYDEKNYVLSSSYLDNFYILDEKLNIKLKNENNRIIFENKDKVVYLPLFIFQSLILKDYHIFKQKDVKLHEILGNLDSTFKFYLEKHKSKIEELQKSIQLKSIYEDKFIFQI